MDRIFAYGPRKSTSAKSERKKSGGSSNQINPSAVNIIPALRETAGLSQAKLAELVGTSQSQIMRIECGEITLTKHWAERLSSVLGSSPEEIMFTKNYKSELNSSAPERPKNAIREKRIQAKMSLETLANNIGMSISQLSRIERGEREPRLKELKSVALQLGISVGELLEHEPQQRCTENANLTSLTLFISDWVDSALMKSGMSQATLSRKISTVLGRSLDRAAVNKLVSGKRSLAADEMLAIAELTAHPVPKLGPTKDIELISSSTVLSAFEILFCELMRNREASNEKLSMEPRVLAETLLKTLQQLPSPPEGVTVDQMTRVETARVLRQF